MHVHAKLPNIINPCLLYVEGSVKNYVYSYTKIIQVSHLHRSIGHRNILEAYLYDQHALSFSKECYVRNNYKEWSSEALP